VGTRSWLSYDVGLLQDPLDDLAWHIRVVSLFGLCLLVYLDASRLPRGPVPRHQRLEGKRRYSVVSGTLNSRQNRISEDVIATAGFPISQ
jgi:hypothetical protein